MNGHKKIQQLKDINKIRIQSATLVLVSGWLYFLFFSLTATHRTAKPTSKVRKCAHETLMRAFLSNTRAHTHYPLFPTLLKIDASLILNKNSVLVF